MTPHAFVPNAATRVWACVVCYRASVQSVTQLLGLLTPQVAHVVLVDNDASATSGLRSLAAGTVAYLPMNGNRGTAGGMNEAWRLALAAGADALISFDQDSRPGAGMVEQLLAAYRGAADQSRPYAAIGPSWRDARSGQTMRILKPVRALRYHVAPSATGLVEADHVITSGCLIPSAAYQNVGPYNERLFLDYVDTEWSLRARSLGWQVGIATSSTMSHAIGDRVVRFAGRSLMLHAPMRNYLVLRNHLLLWSLRFIPLGWLLSDLVQVTAKLAASLLLAPARAQRLRWIGRALRDGLRGRGGPPP